MRPVAVLSAACLASLLASPALAAWPHSPYTNLPVVTAAGEQSTHAMVADGSGGAIVAWQDLRNGAHYDIYAQHILSTGTVDPAWPVNGRLVCGAANSQQFPAIASDGAGGAIISWQDFRNGAAYDIYAQHVLASGAVDLMWPSDGRALCTAGNNQTNPQMVSDGNGGAIVTWTDARFMVTDIYAQHVQPYGAVDMLWPVDGRALCSATGTQQNQKICTDLAGGAVVVWTDYRSAQSDVYAQRVVASGTVDPPWPADGRAVCTAANDQFFPAIESDGSGGALIAWEDYRGGATSDVYGSHILGNSALNWSSNGIALCTAANYQINVSMTRDGGAGVVLAWQDGRSGTSFDVYAHHLLSTGLDNTWPADGRAVCTATADQQSPAITGDGSGGAIVCWQDTRAATGTYAQHVSGAGTVDPIWPTDGRALSSASTSQVNPRIVTDGTGGAIAAWSESRSTSSDLYAQRVARFGYLGTPEPVIASVTDVPNDQGGRAKVSWEPSWLDGESDPNLNFYEVWRSVPGSSAQAALRSGMRRLSSLAERRTAHAIVATATGYWEYLASQNAVHYIPGYAYLAATTGDSVGGYNPKTAFMVVARNTAGTIYWLSAPVSGYSVDNIAPAAPAPFTGQYAGGSASLHWDPNVELDLAGYRLYRGSTSGFVPSPGSRIAELTDTNFVDAAGSPYYYKLSAIDSHGNESGFSLLLPAGAAAVEGGAASVAFALASPSPNPAAGSVALRWTLPREGAASLAVFDPRGRRLRVLASGTSAAGEHATVWNLRDDRGVRVPAGLYFVRLSGADGERTRRLVVMR